MLGSTSSTSIISRGLATASVVLGVVAMACSPAMAMAMIAVAVITAMTVAVWL